MREGGGVFAGHYGIFIERKWAPDSEMILIPYVCALFKVLQ